MDDRPIDPFNPYARRYSPKEWPPAEPAIDDTQDIPVVPPAPGMDDTQEVPVVPRQAAAPPQEFVPVEPVPDTAPVFPAPGPPPADGPPQWPTGVREPTTAVPAPAATAPPFGPELTVPADLVPPRPGGKSVRKPLIAVGAGVAVLVALVGVVIFALAPDSGGDAPDQAAATSPAEAETGEDSGSPSDESKSPSKNPKPESDKTSDPEPTQDAGDEPPPEQKLTVPSRPTKFGAWFAGDGTYEAKWGKPADDGGSDILSYIVGDCKGNNLAFVDSGTYRVSVTAEHLDCMSVYAVNDQGMGTEAQHQITNNP